MSQALAKGRQDKPPYESLDAQVRVAIQPDEPELSVDGCETPMDRHAPARPIAQP